MFLQHTHLFIQGIEIKISKTPWSFSWHILSLALLMYFGPFLCMCGCPSCSQVIIEWEKDYLPQFKSIKPVWIFVPANIAFRSWVFAYSWSSLSKRNHQWLWDYVFFLIFNKKNTICNIFEWKIIGFLKRWTWKNVFFCWKIWNPHDKYTSNKCDRHVKSNC